MGFGTQLTISMVGKMEGSTDPSIFIRDTYSLYCEGVINMNKYTYEEVREAYKAIIKVGEARVKGLVPYVATQLQHSKNLVELEGGARDLYEKLINDDSINY